jgi:hypothetical protein
LGLGFALLAGLGGCGEKKIEASNVPVKPVKGKVMLGSQPLPGGQLKLTLVTNHDKYGQAEAVAAIQPDGSFEPRMVGDKAGLVPGKWKASIDPVYVKDGKGARVSVPARYTKEETSDLVIDVPDGGDTDVVLTLKP